MVVTNASKARTKNCDKCGKSIDKRQGHWSCENASTSHPNGYDICMKCYKKL